MKDRGRILRPLMFLVAPAYLLIVAGCHGNALTPSQSHDAKTGGAWSQFEDPFEQAFSVSVPQEWTVRGGLFRLGYSDERIMVDARSADGTMAVRLGDVAIPSYALPNAQQGRIAAIQRQMRQFEAQMQAMQNQVNAFERRQAAQAGQVKDFTNALIGVTPTTDPLTGEQRDVWTGTKANYWVNGLGQVVNATNAPSADYWQLQVP